MVIREGDLVKVTDPRPIQKIGYERDIDFFTREVEADKEVQRFCRSQDLDSRACDRLIRAVASARVARQVQAGNRRKVFLGEPEEWAANRELLVVAKYVRYVGKYDKGWYCGPDYYGDEDYEPPGLSNREAVIVLLLAVPRSLVFVPYNPPRGPKDYAEGFFVTAPQVEKVKEGGA